MKKQINRGFTVLIVLMALFALLPAPSLFAGSGAQASSDRGAYLAGLGRVIPADEIHIESYIAHSDFNYPFPQSEAVGVVTAAGFNGEALYLVAGLRGSRVDFAYLPPMNLSFVIDISGSMAAQDKMDWVRESLLIFLDRVRPIDYVSLVVFDSSAELLIEPVQINNSTEMERWQRVVRSLRPRGGTNIYAGMEMGFAQVELNFRPDYNNRVILLSDGVDGSGKSRKEFLDMAEYYNDRNINISTISLGADADINLMVDIAIQGGGSSRFISDRVVMEQTFGSELDRLIVAAARDLQMEIVLANGIGFADTWGYSHWTNGSTIHYSLDTLHNGDYETLVVEAYPGIAIPPGTVLGNFFITYTDTQGQNHRHGPLPIVMEQEAGPLMTNPIAREAEGYIATGRGLIEIANLAPPLTAMQQEFNRLRDETFAATRADLEPGTTISDLPDSPEMADLRGRILDELLAIIIIVESLSTHLNNINDSLVSDRYDGEFRILDSYRTSFTRSWDAYILPEF